MSSAPPHLGSRYLTPRILRRVFLGLPALLFLVLTGDRLRLSRPDPQRIRFAHTFTTESERSILAALIAEFEAAHPGIRVEQNIANSEVYNSVGWRLQFQGRNQPDLYFHWQGFKVDLCIARGWAMDLLPHLDDAFLDQFVPTALDRRADGLFSLPHSIDVCNAVWYNKTLFEDHGLQPPRTFEQWTELCRRLHALGILPLAQGNRDLWPMGNFAAEIVGQALGAEGSAALFEPGTPVPDTAAHALQPIEELRQAGAFDLPGVLDPGSIGGLGDIDAKVLFLSGRSAMHVVGSWFLADITDAAAKGELGFEVGLFAVPPGEGQTDAMTGVTTCYLVHPGTANPEATLDFLKLLVSARYQAAFAALGNLSARSDARDFTRHPLALELLDILAQAPAVVPPPDTGYRPDQANAFYDVVGRLVAGRLSPMEAVALWNRHKTALAAKGL